MSANNVVRVATRGGPFSGADPRVMKRRADKMLSYLKLTGVELSVALVGDPVMRDLNRDYRGKNRPTDVLAFAMSEGEPLATGKGEPEILGDVVISIDTAEKQAARAGRTLLDELTMLLAHGLLHLLGYDHLNKAQEREMKRRTRELEEAAVRRVSRSS